MLKTVACYTHEALERFGADKAAAIEWLRAEHAQQCYIAANARHLGTVNEARANGDAAMAAWVKIENSIPDSPLPRIVMAAIVGIAALGMSFTWSRAETPSRADNHAFIIVAVDRDGGEWIAGAGDTCELAAENAVMPANAVSVECIRESGE